MKIKKKKIFYDIHCHAFNLSHAGLLAFLNRFFLDNTLTFNDLLNGNLFQILLQIIFPSKSKKISKNKLIKFLIRIFPVIIIITSLGIGVWYWYYILTTYLFDYDMKYVQIWKLTVIWILSILAFIFSIALIIILIIGFYNLKKFIQGKKNLSQKISRAVNVLSIFENDIGRQLRYIELDYMSLNKPVKNEIEKFHGKVNVSEFNKRINSKWQQANNSFTIDGEQFNKVILTPLIMDFNYKGFDDLNKKKVHYNLAPRKPIIDQAIDLFNGIQDYRKSTEFDLLEVFPFLGINTENYDLGVNIKISSSVNVPEALKQKVKYISETKNLILLKKLNDEDIRVIKSIIKNTDDLVLVIKKINKIPDPYFGEDGFPKKNTLPKMLEKYFGERTGEYTRKYTGKYEDFIDNYEKLFPNKKPDSDEIKTFKNDVSSNFFSGIKVYPPLGFNPWPENDPEKFDKVNYLYQFCCEKNIPVTTHCSDGGFVIIDKEIDWEIVSPYTWRKVLDKYPKLKLNFAHFGVEIKKTEHGWGEWINEILSIIDDDKFENVYTDFSDIGKSNKEYKKLVKAINKFADKKFSNKPGDKIKFYEKISGHILFGTDFMVNLFGIDSYLEYLEIFSLTDAFQSPLNKLNFCKGNPERFLFG